MTKLEEEIFENLSGFNPNSEEGKNLLIYTDYETFAKDAAEVAKRYIEKAYEQALLDLVELQKYYKDPLDIAHMTAYTKEGWLKENGII